MPTPLRVFCLFLSTTLTAWAGPTAIFDGRSLAGWEGDVATWRVVDGCIEAGSLERNQPRNEFLTWREELANFDLTLRWKVEGTKGFVNGGVQLRSRRVPFHHEMVGYQADLGAGYDGGLYDESRRNRFLAQPDAATKAKALKPTGEWNTYRIRAEGPRIQIWLNGVQTVDYVETDPAIPLTGQVAVQIHGNAFAVVRYKDIALEKLPDSPAAPAAEATTAAAPVDAKTTADAGPLFNGRDLTGWDGEAAAFWSVVDGALTSSGAPQPRGSWLRTDRELENFDLTFRARTQGRVGTGLFFRSAVEPGKPILGWQLDIGAGLDGGLYKEGPKGGLISYPDRAKAIAAAKPGEWNEYRLRAEGRRLRTWVNGVAMQDHEEKGPRRSRGALALELSPGSTGRAAFKDFRLELLPDTPEAIEEPSTEGPVGRMTDRLAPRPRPAPFADGRFTATADDVVILAGPENMVLEQGHGYLESLLTARLGAAAPRFRHLGWEGDTVFRQNRMMEWGDWRANLRGAGATTVFAWFGQVEALDPTRSPEEFATAYEKLLREFAQVTPRLVVLGPTPFEKPRDPRVRDNTGLNPRLVRFAGAAEAIARRHGFLYVDLLGLRAPAGETLTRDGLHLTPTGARLVAAAVADRMTPGSARPDEALRTAIVAKNRLWFDTWRCMNWAFAYGDRTTQPFAKGAPNHPSFVEEIRQHQPMLAHADAVIRAHVAGQASPAAPPALPGRADPPAPTPAEQLAGFKVRPGFRVNLFADESLGVIRPVQIRWDERGRLWVACTPAYPQLQPGEHGKDFILVLEDADGDGRADKSWRFAEGLTMPLGFEFAPTEAGGGLYVVESTQLIHLTDRDGDGKADGRVRILSGFGTGDTHQDANSLRWGPDGCLWFTQGYHIWSYVETPYGLAELNRSGIWRFNPRTLRLDSFLNESAAGLNCWGTAWDDQGQMFHGSGADTPIWHSTPGLIPTLHPQALPTALAHSRGKSMEPEILGSSHLPEELRGVLLKSTYFTSQVQLYRLRDQGSSFRTEDLGDLLAGGKEFRPVETRVGPEGAIYVADWLNPVIGHYQASYRDPRRDQSHGRIWRITAEGRATLPRPALGTSTATELIPRLASPERWERDAAKFRLYRLPAAEVRVALSSVDLTQATPAMLFELSGVFAAHEQPSATLVKGLLAADDFRYRAWGAGLLAGWGAALPEARALLRRAARDPHPRVRMSAVVACGWAPPAWGAEAAQIATLVLEQPLDAALEHALTQTIHALAPAWQAADAKGKLGLETRPEALARLYTTMGQTDSVAKLKALAERPGLTAEARLKILAVLIQTGAVPEAEFALRQEPNNAALADVWVATARLRTGLDYGPLVRAWLARPEPFAQATACRVIAVAGKDYGALPKLEDWLAEGTAPEVRLAAISAYARVRKAESLTRLAPLLEAADATVRDVALAALAPHAPAAVAEGSGARLEGCRDDTAVGPIFAPLLELKGGPALLAQALTKRPPKAEAARLALQWMAQVGRDDAEVRRALQAAAGVSETLGGYDPALVARLVAAAQATGDAGRGEAIAKSAARACLSCHQFGGQGGAIGPDLSAVGRAMSPEAIVESVLWPKRQVKEGYLLTQVTTKDGRELQGYRVGETAEQLTLRNFAVGGVDVVAKANLAARSDVGSIMPEGLTAGLTPAELADLFRYLFDLGK
jgi:putative heme-binding domain-containing protein